MTNIYVIFRTAIFAADCPLVELIAMFTLCIPGGDTALNLKLEGHDGFCVHVSETRLGMDS